MQKIGNTHRHRQILKPTFLKSVEFEKERSAKISISDLKQNFDFFFLLNINVCLYLFLI